MDRIQETEASTFPSEMPQMPSWVHGETGDHTGTAMEGLWGRDATYVIVEKRSRRGDTRCEAKFNEMLRKMEAEQTKHQRLRAMNSLQNVPQCQPASGDTQLRGFQPGTGEDLKSISWRVGSWAFHVQQSWFRGTYQSYQPQNTEPCRILFNRPLLGFPEPGAMGDWKWWCSLHCVRQQFSVVGPCSP